MTQAEVEDGERPGLTRDARSELVRLRRDNRVQAMEIEILKRASAYFARVDVLPKRGFRLVHELADGSVPVAVINGRPQ